MTIAVLEALTFGLGRLVAAADQAGQRLCLRTGNRGIYRHELAHLSPDALDVVDIDTKDVAACAAALKELPDLRGLINSTDTWMLPGSELAAQFELPGPDPVAVRGLRDKRSVRAQLHERGLSRGTAVDVPSGPEGAAVVREKIGLPAVLKDTAGTGSRNVWLVRDEAERTLGLRLVVTKLAGKSDYHAGVTEQQARRTRMSAQDRRESILGAAAEVFAELGYLRGKTSAVAHKVGVSEPVVFLLQRGRAEGDLRADLDASAAAWWLLSLVASQKFRGATAADPAEVEARLAESTLVFLTQEAPSGFGDPANRANVCYTATRGVVVGRHSSARLPPAPCGLST